MISDDFCQYIPSFEKLLPTIMRHISDHASERQTQRGIKRNYIKLCINKGTRTNIPPSTKHDNLPAHKYVYYGLCVICCTQIGTVITAYWCTSDDKELNKYIATYNDLLKNKFNRSETRKKNNKHVKRGDEWGREWGGDWGDVWVDG